MVNVKWHFINFEINANTLSLTILRGMVIDVIAVFSAVKRKMYDINNIYYSFILFIYLRFSQSGSSLLKLGALSLDESLFPYYRYV
jgi:hypothetical protein